MSDGEITEIGPECFASIDDTVISWKGVNYYKACGAVVTNDITQDASFCVKRVDHPGDIHEDYDGFRKTENKGRYAVVVTVPFQGDMQAGYEEIQQIMQALKAQLGDKEDRKVYHAIRETSDQLIMILEGDG